METNRDSNSHLIFRDGKRSPEEKRYECELYWVHIRPWLEENGFKKKKKVTTGFTVTEFSKGQKSLILADIMDRFLHLPVGRITWDLLTPLLVARPCHAAEWNSKAVMK